MMMMMIDWVSESKKEERERLLVFDRTDVYMGTTNEPIHLKQFSKIYCNNKAYHAAVCWLLKEDFFSLTKQKCGICVCHMRVRVLISVCGIFIRRNGTKIKEVFFFLIFYRIQERALKWEWKNSTDNDGKHVFMACTARWRNAAYLLFYFFLNELWRPCVVG